MNQVIIIVDGPDNSGKSHIAAELSRRTLIPVFKYPKSDSSALTTKYCDTVLSEFFKHVPVSVIFDRHYVTEYVYSQVFNRTVMYNELIQIDQNMAEVGAFIVICLKSDYQQETYHDDHTPYSKVHQLVEKYNEFIEWTKNKNVLVLDTTDENLDAQINTIIDFIYEKMQKENEEYETVRVTGGLD